MENKLYSESWFKNILEKIIELHAETNLWDFKQYILGILFYRYISENLANYINKGEIDAGNKDFNYAELDDQTAELARNDMILTKGFFILPSELFQNVCSKASKDSNLNETLERVFASIEHSAQGTSSEDNFKGLFDDLEVNNRILGETVVERNIRLYQLLKGIYSIELGDFEENKSGAFGDAYEFLLKMYALKAGKKGGNYFTPSELSEVLVKITLVGKNSINKVYDPACGSGSLLLKFASILGEENIRSGFFGQDIDFTMYNFSRFNMIFHDINYDNFDIAYGDTLKSPRSKHIENAPFEAIVSNMEASKKWEGNDNPLLINDPRYSAAGVLAPKKYHDFAFILHSLYLLSNNGVAAFLVFPGILYRGGAEQKIRKYLVKYIDAVIHLADKISYGHSMDILVLKKSKDNANILFINASNEFIKVGKEIKLTRENQDSILALYTNREDVDYKAKLATYKDIEENDFNLSVSTYVVNEDTREDININVLNEEIEEIVQMSNDLRNIIKSSISGSKEKTYE